MMMMMMMLMMMIVNCILFYNENRASITFQFTYIELLGNTL